MMLLTGTMHAHDLDRRIHCIFSPLRRDCLAQGRRLADSVVRIG